MYTFQKYKRCLQILIDNEVIWTIPVRRLQRTVKDSYVEANGCGYGIGIYPDACRVELAQQVEDLIANALS